MPDMMKKRVFIKLFILMILTYPLTGCWDYKEYEDLALVSAMGIDMDEQTGQIITTIQYMVPGSSQGGDGSGNEKAKVSSNNIAIDAASGLTIDEALLKIQKVVGKKLFYGYLEIEIIGENAAKNIIEDITGLNDRTPEIRTNAYLLVASGKAFDALSTVEPNLTGSPGKHIRELVDASGMIGSSYPMIIEDFIECLQKEGIEALAPRIVTTPLANGGGKSNDVFNETSGIKNKIEKKDGYHKVDGIAIFKKAELKGWLDGDETKGLAWIRSKGLSTYVNFKPKIGADVKDTLIFRVTKSKGSIKTVLYNGKPMVILNVYTEIALRKYGRSMIAKELTSEAIVYMQENLGKKINSEVNKTIYKCQKEFGSDIFGVGQAFYRQHLSSWRNTYEKSWDKTFPNLPVTVKAKVKVINTGTNIIKFFSK